MAPVQDRDSGIHIARLRVLPDYELGISASAGYQIWHERI
ncbi:hypothetical protein LAX5112_00428 [Roseibium alexandrii]|uniref:Uncharacterized protein n=1 Tax=Roseibium alexandrii TaxID=388408 RepID=A0A0M6ZTM4_9HYPH|nr:hypothetical protein LAX5112_00428 [Roseibium alexandrii]